MKPPSPASKGWAPTRSECMDEAFLDVLRPRMNRHGSARSHLTLALCTILHGFTHAYGSMLVPLYFRIASDLKLSGVGAATLDRHPLWRSL